MRYTKDTCKAGSCSTPLVAVANFELRNALCYMYDPPHPATLAPPPVPTQDPSMHTRLLVNTTTTITIASPPALCTWTKQCCNARHVESRRKFTGCLRRAAFFWRLLTFTNKNRRCVIEGRIVNGRRSADRRCAGRACGDLRGADGEFVHRLLNVVDQQVCCFETTR